MGIKGYARQRLRIVLHIHRATGKKIKINHYLDRIYKEIGAGERISLCKLAVDTLEQTGRPLQLAIDFSIWQFQAQAARGTSMARPPLFFPPII